MKLVALTLFAISLSMGISAVMETYSLMMNAAVVMESAR